MFTLPSVTNDIATSTFGPLDDYGLDAGIPNDVDASPTVTKVNNSLPKRATELASMAAELVGGDRDRQHGQKKDNFARIATMWNAWLRTRKDPAEPLNAHDVGVMMVVMKLARTQSGAVNEDDYTDACGYSACAGEIALAEQEQNKD